MQCLGAMSSLSEHRRFQTRASLGIARVKFWSVVLIAYHLLSCGTIGQSPPTGAPVAAAEREKQVLVSISQSFQVCDLLRVDIPASMDGSWYDSQVFVGIKESVFEPSSALKHASKVHDILLTEMGTKSVLFLYTDGGPDHRKTYISTQLSLIALFLNLNLDYLCAARTTPHNSWRNPAERITSIFNLGFQSIGLMRSEMSEPAEAA